MGDLIRGGRRRQTLRDAIYKTPGLAFDAGIVVVVKVERPLLGTVVGHRLPPMAGGALHPRQYNSIDGS